MNKHNYVLHGSFLNIFGVGTHIMGKPGIGKSELALSLTYRMHQLIADDVPIYFKKEHQVIGKSQNLQRFISVRGIGIINIEAIVGTAALKESHTLNLIIHLLDYVPETKVDADLEGIHDTKEILGIMIPVVTIPIIRHRNLELLIETIVKNYLLKTSKGYDPVRDFEAMLEQRMGQNH